MTPGRIVCLLAVMAAFCVLALFFFPGMEGPYSAVHGPVTALLSIRAASLLRTRMVRAGLNAIRGFLRETQIRLVSGGWAALVNAEFPASSLTLDCSSVLRC